MSLLQKETLEKSAMVGSSLESAIKSNLDSNGLKDKLLELLAIIKGEEIEGQKMIAEYNQIKAKNQELLIENEKLKYRIAHLMKSMPDVPNS